MNTTIKSQSADSRVLPKKKKSLFELIEEKIPKGKYAGITKMLEPHEIPELNRK